MRIPIARGRRDDERNGREIDIAPMGSKGAAAFAVGDASTAFGNGRMPAPAGVPVHELSTDWFLPTG